MISLALTVLAAIFLGIVGLFALVILSHIWVFICELIDYKEVKEEVEEEFE